MPVTGANDAEIARLAVAGDASAWHAIFERHYLLVYAFARSRVAPPEAAEDIAARAFEIAYARRASFDYTGVPIAAWLIGIARNLVREDHRRARRHREDATVAADMVASPDPAAGLILQHDLAVALDALTDDQRTVLTLRFLVDWSVADTARAMQRSEDAVKTLQRRALLALRGVLAAQDYPVGGAQ